jgi:glycerophosphoryl diester phosphodiesterase
MPTLDEILAIVPPGKMFYIEVKCGPEIVPAIDEALKKSSVKPEQIRIICFKAEVIAAAKQRMPHIKTQWLASFKEDKKTGALTPKTDTIAKTLEKTKADGFNAQANLKVMTPEYVKQLQARGLEVGVWTVDDPAVAKAAADMKVFGITTNRPAFIREQLGGGSKAAAK